jgi:hypothetical protein
MMWMLSNNVPIEWKELFEQGAVRSDPMHWGMGKERMGLFQLHWRFVIFFMREYSFSMSQPWDSRSGFDCGKLCAIDTVSFKTGYDSAGLV